MLLSETGGVGMKRPQGSSSTEMLLLHSYAQAVKAACIEAAINGHEQAGISGLCQEGRFEAAISAIRMLDVDTISVEPR